jgi:hypothetical protein
MTKLKISRPVLDVPYELVSGLKITPEIAYVDNFDNAYDNYYGPGDGVEFDRSFQ